MLSSYTRMPFKKTLSKLPWRFSYKRGGYAFIVYSNAFSKNAFKTFSAVFRQCGGHTLVKIKSLFIFAGTACRLCAKAFFCLGQF